MKDEIKTVSGYGRIFPKEIDTDESVIFLKLKNLVKQAVISQQECTNGRRKTKSGHIILEFCSYLNLYPKHSATCR